MADENRLLGVAVLGVGRMGRRHALNTAFFTPRARLVAVCDPIEACLQWAEENLPASVRRQTDFQQIFDDPQVQAVVIATETSSHARLAVEALRAGKHVLLEKPISINPRDSEPVLAAAKENEVEGLKLKCMVGLSRRFDESYKEVKRQIDAGLLGTPYLIKSATNDMYDPSGFFVKFSEASGGLIVDCGIHDIDMARWLFGLTTAVTTSDCDDAPRVKRVFSTGLSVRHPELAKTNDADNAICVVEFTGGKVLDFHLSRTGLHGHDCLTEVFGSERKVIVNGNPTINRVEIRDQHGVRTESTPTYYERFREAFVTEVNEFVACCLDDTVVPVSLDDAVQAGKIADALTHAFRTGKQVLFGDDGEAIYE